MQIILSESARRDLRSISLHYALYADINTAHRHIEDIVKGISRIAEFPDIGRVVEDDRLGPGYRRYYVEEFWVVYVGAGDSLLVLRVYHEKQDFDIFEVIDFE